MLTTRDKGYRIVSLFILFGNGEYVCLIEIQNIGVNAAVSAYRLVVLFYDSGEYCRKKIRGMDILKRKHNYCLGNNNFEESLEHNLQCFMSTLLNQQL